MPTSVSGRIVNLDGTAAGTNSFVRFWLRATRGNEPRITATGAIAPQAAGSSFYVDIPADASGNVSGSIYSTRASDGVSNGEIECGGSLIAVWYGMQIYNASIPGPEVPVHAKQGTTLLVQNVTPITTLPVVASPTGDAVYARLDGGNSPFSGRIQQNGGDLVVSRTTTDTLTNKTLNGGASGNAVTLLNAQGPLSALVGNSADQTIYTYTIPANTIQAGKGFRVTFTSTHSTGTAVITYKLILGTTTLINWGGSASAGVNTNTEADILNVSGVQNSQFGQGTSFDSAAVQVNQQFTSAENLANALTLKMTFNVANTDQITPRFWLVELIQ